MLIELDFLLSFFPIEWCDISSSVHDLKVAPDTNYQERFVFSLKVVLKERS